MLASRNVAQAARCSACTYARSPLRDSTRKGPCKRRASAAAPREEPSAAIDVDASTVATPSTSPQAAVHEADQQDEQKARLVQDEMRAEAMRLLLLERLKGITTGRWLQTPSWEQLLEGGGTPQGDEAGGATATATAGPGPGSSSSSSAGASSGMGSAAQAASASISRARAPLMARLLACASVLAFAWQWWPLLPLAAERLGQLDLRPLAAMALVVPSTSTAAAWSLVRSLINGSGLSRVRSWKGAGSTTVREGLAAFAAVTVALGR